jgi:hypothetical protein
MQGANSSSITGNVDLPASRRATVQVSVKQTTTLGTHSRRLWASAAAAGLSEALTMPVDVAKIRLQVQNNGPVGDVRYKGMTDCILRTVRNEGFRALFKGLGPALMRQMGYTGISFLLYEPIRNGISPAGTMIACPCVCFDSAMFLLSARNGVMLELVFC